MNKIGNGGTSESLKKKGHIATKTYRARTFLARFTCLLNRSSALRFLTDSSSCIKRTSQILETLIFLTANISPHLAKHDTQQIMHDFYESRLIVYTIPIVIQCSKVKTKQQHENRPPSHRLHPLLLHVPSFAECWLP